MAGVGGHPPGDGSATAFVCRAAQPRILWDGCHDPIQHVSELLPNVSEDFVGRNRAVWLRQLLSGTSGNQVLLTHGPVGAVLPVMDAPGSPCSRRRAPLVLGIRDDHCSVRELDIVARTVVHDGG